VCRHAALPRGQLQAQTAMVPQQRHASWSEPLCSVPGCLVLLQAVTFFRKLTRLLSRHYVPQPCGCRLEEVRREAQDAELRAAQLADEVRAASEALADRMGAYQETATQFFSCAAPMGYPQGG